MEYDPNARAFASSETPAPTVEPVVEDEGTTTVEEESTETRVPYSRFESANKRAREAEAELARLRSERQESVQPRKVYGQYEDEIRREIKDLYGDNDVAQRITDLQIAQMERIERLAEERALKALEEREVSEVRRIESNEETIDSRLESLSDYLGRPLTQKEEDAVLAIADEYTPQENGQYLGELMSFDKAYEIYEMRQAQAGTRSKESRATATALTGTRTSGEPGRDSDNANFDPRDWNSYKNRLNS